MLGDSAEMDDLFLDDLDNIFDDDGPVDDSLEMESGNLDFLEPEETQSFLDSSVLSQVGSVFASLAPISIEHRRRRSSQNRGADGSSPAPEWHSEDGDRAHREKMIHEV
jgi:hypothetical protein